MNKISSMSQRSAYTCQSFNNITMYTKELITLFQNKAGYRNDDIGSHRSYKSVEVIDYEYNELNNTDIMETVRVYETLPVALNTPHTDEDYERNYQIIEDLITTHYKDYYAFWLCASPQDVVDNYLWYLEDEGETTVEVQQYQLPDDAIILSDLGEQGILIMSKVPQQRLYLDTLVIEI